jgi:hypothetical protein
VVDGFSRRGRDGIGLIGGPVDMVALLVSLDRRPEAEEILRSYIRDCDHLGHLEYLRTYLPTIGMAHLVGELMDVGESGP